MVKKQLSASSVLHFNRKFNIYKLWFMPSIYLYIVAEKEIQKNSKKIEKRC